MYNSPFLFPAPFLFAALAVPPVLLSILNIIQICRKENKRTNLFLTEFFGIVIGAVYYFFAIQILGNGNITWVSAEEQISEIYCYPPVDPSLHWVLVLISVIAFAGWLFLRLCPVRKQPPLLTVSAFISLYVMMAVFVITEIQLCTFKNGGEITAWLIALVFPANLVVIIAKLIKEQAAERKDMPVSDGMSWAAKLLSRSAALPVFAFILFALFIGIILILLVLFGQSPDEIIKIWTNTAEWTLSQRVPPPKVPYDGHYLCTVAANGHEKLVKPLRTGRRNGHTVLVNRQLQIANAFEDLIHERTPRFHKAVRSFYDRTGLPISRYITTPIRSDIIYIVMKPLEWLFLAVLYLCDAKPENRIAVQYMGQRTK